MAGLEELVRAGRPTVEHFIVDGDTIADIHAIDAENTNGDKVRVKVIAFFTVRAERSSLSTNSPISFLAQTRIGTWAPEPRARKS